MSDSPEPTDRDRRWPRAVYGVGTGLIPASASPTNAFLAWIRTSLGFLAAGVAIAAVSKFSDQLSSKHGSPRSC